MDNSILSELHWRADSGALIFKDVRYLLIRPETLIAFQKAVEAEVGVERAGDWLYVDGFTAGLFGVTVQAREIACLAHGDPVCRFEIEAGE